MGEKTYINTVFQPARKCRLSLSKNYPNGPVSGIIEETGVFSWKTGEKTHGES